MKIKLNEIPEEGRHYEFNRETAELNFALSDLIADEAYDVQVYIKPLNQRDFTISGTIKTKTKENCSRCGDLFKFNVQKKLKDILIPKQEEDRTGKYAKTSVSVSESEDDVDVIEYSNNQFDIAEYIHESVAIEIPFNPLPPSKLNGDCSICDKPLKGERVIYDENLGVEKTNPFASLKNIKLN